MEVRHATAPSEVPTLDTTGLRARFLVEDLFAGPGIRLTYSHHDRLVVGGVVVGDAPVDLPAPAPLRASAFLDRRELGVVNVGTADAAVEVDGRSFSLAARECLYVGRGARVVRFSGDGARLYLVSTAAHAVHPTRRAALADATPVKLGSVSGSNERTIYKYIHADGIRSCQLVLGVTVLADGSMWNTMPCHTHDRRTEVYCYFDLPPEHRVVHLMGRPDETRNLIVADGEAVISPPWSVHCGFGTHSYSFVWAMGGENQAYDDLEPVDVRDLR
ncbi:5-dehydro-4-deoxy-D-glucuronate isomerase [Virgisporangium aurantiacum]|uniref:4-deoxy-L-threo-5-hexosulose-uronate ketol-isomerase n=1 Tax=Virgisporangium aurantiacum TaxID=175570 RepID=A0A8J3ZG80_9ACTN|nr:5-dehydro-4-deoxy-D-glucuronate isomerase [Virgisporangium aurantiacum]GIJ60773.1 4-deoxy-L-threo-5-hexosulose-uronate ketol-isomerase [Virgisporangium aurantiacum]